MIGVFDSGVGGLTVIREIRRLLPDVDVCFFKDTKNAPYGTKSRDKLIDLVQKDICTLLPTGASPILIACCTASTVHKYLSEELRRISIPIISPAARKAAAVTNGKIGVIATEATVRSEAFSIEINKFNENAEVVEIATQELVSLVEAGAVDGHIESKNKKAVMDMLTPLEKHRIDTLVLGCTHFPHLEKTISECLPGVKIVSPSREGALELIRRITPSGDGKTVYL